VLTNIVVFYLFILHQHYRHVFCINNAKLIYRAIGSLSLSQVELKGIAAALEKHNGPNVEAKGVKAHFNMDESGILNLLGAELSFEKTVTEADAKKEDDFDSTLSKLGSTISKLFSGDDQKADASSGEKEAEKEPEASSTTTTPAPDTVKNDTAPAEAPKPKITIIKESLKINEEKLDLIDLDGEKFTNSKTK
jgi:hypoxia up-regulated 1